MRRGVPTTELICPNVFLLSTSKLEGLANEGVLVRLKNSVVNLMLWCSKNLKTLPTAKSRFFWAGPRRQFRDEFPKPVAPSGLFGTTETAWRALGFMY